MISQHHPTNNNKKKKDKTESKRYVRRWYGKPGWNVQILSTGPGAGEFVARTEVGDFCVKNSRHGRGCFTQQDLKCRQMVGVYPGQITNEKQLAMKLSRLPMNKQPTVNQYLVQSRLHSTSNSNCYLDPTDAHANLDKAWNCNPVLFVNEPDSDQETNLMPVWNYDNDRLELWTRDDLKAGAELFISYGSSFERNYDASSSSRPPAEMMIRDSMLQPFVPSVL